MRQKILLVGFVCILIIFSLMGLSWSQENNFPLEGRIEQLKEELYKMYSLLEEEKQEYIRQHPIKVDIEMEPGVLWELTKETEGEESYRYFEEYVKYFPDSSKVQDAMWYMISMVQMEKVDKDPFPLLDEYAKAFPADEANTTFARACIYYNKAGWLFWLVTTTQEGVRDNKEDVLKGIEIFQKATVLAKPKDRFKGFKSQRGLLIRPYPFWESGNIQESARWNIAVGYERLKMWEKAIEAYSLYLLEYPESDEADRAKAKIYLMRQELGQSETVKSSSKEEIQEKTEEKTLPFSTPENTIKTLVETIAFGDKNFASQYFSNRQYNSEIVTRNFYEVLKEQNLISQVKELTYSTTELDEETCLVWIFPPGNDKKSLSWKVIQEEGRWHALSYCYYRLSSGINWDLEDLEEWKDKGYKLQNLRLTDELDSKETCLISIFTPFSDNPSWPGPRSGTFGPFDKYSQSLNNALVIYRIEEKDTKKLSQYELASGPNDISLELMDIDNNGSKEIVVKSTWCGASACSYKIEILNFRNNHLIQIRTPDISYRLSYELVDINKDGVYELLSAGFSYLWDCAANTVYSSLVWSLEKDQYKRDPQSFSTFYQEKIKEIEAHITEELTKSEEEFRSGDYFKDVISLYVNYSYIDQNEKGYQEIKKWISESKFVSTWDKYYKKRLGLCEDIIEEVKLEMNEWKIKEMEDVSSEIPKSTVLPAEEQPEEES